MTTNKFDMFTLLALSYIAVPNILFLSGWVHLFIGIPVAVVLLLAIVWISKEVQVPQRVDRKILPIICMVGASWTLLSGVGGLVPQSGDYIKHNVLFHDLANIRWPVTYGQNSHDITFLCYGVGYYLVPAALSWLAGEHAINALSFLWATAGVSLFFYWLVALFQKPDWRRLLIFLLFSTLGVVWYVVKRSHYEYFQQLGIEHSYFDHWTKLYFTPQHGISGWLGAALIYHLGWSNRSPSSAFFAWANLVLWSPFVSVGLFPILLATVSRVSWTKWFSAIPFLGGLLLTTIMGIYFSAHQSLEHQGPIWVMAGDHHWFLYYFLFVSIEVFLPTACVLYFDYKHQILEGWRTLFLFASVGLFLFPLYKMGHESDLRLQGSGGLVVFVALGVAACVSSPFFSLRTVEGLLVAFFVATAAVYPVGRPLLNLKSLAEDYSFKTIERTMDIHNMSEIGKPEKASGFDMAQQYLGRNESAAYRLILRR